jgi:hypothetical protein
MQELIDFVKNNTLVQILIAGAILYFFMQYNKETLDNVSGTSAPVQAPSTTALPQALTSVSEKAAPASVSVADQQQAHVDSIVAGSSQLTTSDLLPVYDDANDFAKQNPVSKLLSSQNYLQAGFHSGINTVIQSNKIPYLDLRSCPPIPKQEVGPWQQSSFEQSAGSQRRFMEIGS